MHKFLVVIALFALSIPALARADSTPPPTATPTPTSSPPVYLDNIFVTAQRHVTGQLGTTRQTFILTSSELARTGAQTIGDALALLPGVVIIDYGTSGHVQTTLLRGASSTESLVLINGRPANEPGVGLFDFSSLPVDAVARVEVVEGAASTLYGSAAMGGVINIITRDPVPGAEGSVHVGTGFEGAFNAGADFGAGASAGRGVRVDLSTQHGPNALGYPAFATMAAGSLVNNDTKQQDAFVTVAEKMGRVRAKLHVGDDASDSGEPGSLVFGAPSTLARQQRYFMRGDVTLELPHDRSDVVAQAYSDGQRLHYYDGTSDPSNFIFPYDTLAHLNTRGFGLRDTIDAGASALTFGYDSRGDRAQFDEDFGGALSSAPATDSTTGVFASEELAAARQAMTLTFAVRSEMPQGFAHTVVPSAGALWRAPSSSLELRANYGRAFRIPALEETSPLFFGNPALQPEYAATFDVGASYAGDTIAYFGLRAGNLIVSEPPAFLPENVSLANLRGLSALLQRSIGGGNHALLDYTDYLRATDLRDGNRLPYRPTATGSLRLWHDERETGFGVTLNYVGQRFADDPNTFSLPQFATLGAYLTRVVGRDAMATLRFENVTGERVEYFPGYPVAGPSVSLSLSTSWSK